MEIFSSGAFLIPYFCIYFLIGTPLYFLELSLGQFTSRGATAAFKMSRMFKGLSFTCYLKVILNKVRFSSQGLGWSMAVNSFFVTVYYNIIIAWCLFYMFASFRKKLPWSDCNNWWNTDHCFDASMNSTNSSLCLSSNCTLPTLPPEEYFE